VKKTLLYLCLGLSLSLQAELVMKDLFDNGDLSTAASTEQQINGGFKRIGAFVGDGTASEQGGVAQLENDGFFSQYGILSLNSVDLANPDESTTTWMLKQYALKTKVNAFSLTWQSQSSYTDYPQARVEIDLVAETLAFIVNEQELGSVQIDNEFGNGETSFEIMAVFTDSSFSITASNGLDLASGGPVELTGDWLDGSGTDQRGALGEEMYLGTVIDAELFGTGLEMDVDSITVDAIPEPTVIALLGIYGGGLLFYRRIVARRGSNSQST
jgi:hypothetical protein